MILAVLNLFWAPVNFAVNRATEAGMSPATVGALRWTAMVGLLFAGLATPAFRHATGAKWPTAKECAIALAVGAVFFAPSHLIYYTALRFISTTEGTVFNTTAPLWTAVLAFILLRERVAPRRVAAITIGLVGTWIVSVGFGLPALDSRHTLGNGAYLGAVLMESMASVLTAGLCRRSSGITVLAFLILGSLPVFWLAPAFLPDLLPMSFTGIDGTAFAALAYLVVFPGLIGFGVWYRMVERVPLTLMTVTLLLQPPVSALFGYFFLGEPVTTNLAIGTAIILASLLLGATERRSVATAAGEVPDGEEDEHEDAPAGEGQVARSHVGL